jgi:hypothetical protein
MTWADDSGNFERDSLLFPSSLHLVRAAAADARQQQHRTARTHAMTALLAPCASPLPAARAAARGAPRACTGSPYLPFGRGPRGRACCAADRASADVLLQLEAVPVRAAARHRRCSRARCALLFPCSFR